MNRTCGSVYGSTLLLVLCTAVGRAQATTRLELSVPTTTAAADAAGMERGLRTGLSAAGLRVLPPSDTGAARGWPASGARLLARARAMTMGESLIIQASLVDVAAARVIAQGSTRGAGAALVDSAVALGRRLGRAAAP